jgi:TolB-like protein/Tfp pilus assembly protein PilF
MFTDMVGYTALTQADEKATLGLLKEQEDLLRPLVSAHQGREVKSTGDGFLLEFDSALKATECAIAIQRRLLARNERAEVSPIRLRIGIHLGDVEQRGDDIFGDAVNIAARIQSLAEPGGICISSAVREQVWNKVSERLERLPPAAVRGLRGPLDLYQVMLQSTSQRDQSNSVGSEGIAILPFSNISPDPKDEYFADGLTEELIAVLSRLRGLRVIARTSVMRYKSGAKGIAEIAAELGVSFVLEGSVRKAGDRMRITVQLIEARSQGHVWVSAYDRNLDDIFAVQTDIARRVAESLPSNVLVSATPLSAPKWTPDIRAYMCFLQGQALIYERGEAPLRQSLSLFEQAAQRDASFSRAYVGAAQCYMALGTTGFIAFSEGIERGRDAAEKALSIDPDLAEAHAALAELSLMADDPVVTTEREVRKALDLNPNLADAHALLGLIDALKGDPRAWVDHCEIAYQLDPLSPRTIWSLGRAYFLSGREEDALDHWTRNLHLDQIDALRGLTDYHMARGDLERADAALREEERIGPGHQITFMHRGYLAALKGDHETAREMIVRLESTSSGAFYVACIYHALGDSDRFFECLFTSLKDHVFAAEELMYSPLFSSVRRDPRFKQFLESAHLGPLPPT